MRYELHDGEWFVTMDHYDRVMKRYNDLMGFSAPEWAIAQILAPFGIYRGKALEV